MNPQIKELALQCGAWHQVYDQKLLKIDEHFDVEKFAELIVEKCVINIALDTSNWKGDEGVMAYYQGVQDAVKSMRKHFGAK